MPNRQNSMKIEYRFEVTGHLRLKSTAPINYRDKIFVFEIDKINVVRALSVTIKIQASEIPVATRNPEPGVKLKIDMVSPRLRELLPQVRTLEGFLSMYGVESIDTRHVKHTWIPESAEEQSRLHINGVSTSSGQLGDEAYDQLDLAFAGQAVTALEKLVAYEVPFNFYRRGMLDLRDRRCIDAYYDFFFVIETLFGNGKFKTRQLKEELRSSLPLQEAVAQTLAGGQVRFILASDKHLLPAYRLHYQGRKSAEITDRFVDLRGELHHHSGRDRRCWNPGEQQEFELDATFIGAVCCTVLQAATLRNVYNNEQAARFESAVNRGGAD